MPFIEESDLLELHKDVDKSQIINERLLDQIKFKNKELKKFRIQRNVLASFSGLFIIGAIVLVAFFAGFSSSNRYDENAYQLASKDSLDAIYKRMGSLKLKNEELSLVNEFYLAKKFLNKEIVYSVQVKSFLENNITLASEALTNTMFVKTNPFYSYSLGNFETLEEAQSFRKQLVAMGFDDSFVASYQDGKRIKIEASR